MRRTARCLSAAALASVAVGTAASAVFADPVAEAGPRALAPGATAGVAVSCDKAGSSAPTTTSAHSKASSQRTVEQRTVQLGHMAGVEVAGAPGTVTGVCAAAGEIRRERPNASHVRAGTGEGADGASGAVADEASTGAADASSDTSGAAGGVGGTSSGSAAAEPCLPEDGAGSCAPGGEPGNAFGRESAFGDDDNEQVGRPGSGGGRDDGGPDGGGIDDGDDFPASLGSGGGGGFSSGSDGGGGFSGGSDGGSDGGSGGALGGLGAFGGTGGPGGPGGSADEGVGPGRLGGSGVPGQQGRPSGSDGQTGPGQQPGAGRPGAGEDGGRPGRDQAFQHGVHAGQGGAFTDSVPAMVAGGLLIAGAFGAAAHRLRQRFTGRGH